ncbi:MAG: YraN family protein [Bacteroidales bacterium]|nr:YraN family protein [Bacteroidales bacterium]
MNQKYELGKKGEQLAAEFLRKHGYRIEAERWKMRHLELDLIAIDQASGEIVFIEVKTRKSAAYGAPEQAVDHKKIMNMVHAADAYIKKFRVDRDWRFDIISIIDNGQQTPHIEHFKDAFYPPLG